MTPDVILAFYDWEVGSCFRCGIAGAYTTRLDEITTPSGATYVLRACGCCVLELEEERRRCAERRSTEYRPGLLGS